MRALIDFVMRHRWAAITLGIVTLVAFSFGAIWAYWSYREVPTGELPAITLEEALVRAQEGGARAWVTIRDAKWKCDAYTSLERTAFVLIGQSGDSPVLAKLPTIDHCAEASSTAPHGKLNIANPRLQANLLGADNRPGLRLVIVDMVDTPTILIAVAVFFAIMAVLGLFLIVWAWRKQPDPFENGTLRVTRAPLADDRPNKLVR